MNIYGKDPMMLFRVSLVVLIGWTVLLCFAKKRRKAERILRIVSILLMIVAVYGILEYSVLKRNPSDDHNFVWVSAYNSEFERELFMNALLYYPLGLVLSLLIGPWSILVGFMLSVSIETWQYFAGTGLAQGTDLLMNTLGCAVGFLPWVIAKELERIKQFLRLLYQSAKNCLRKMVKILKKFGCDPDWSSQHGIPSVIALYKAHMRHNIMMTAQQLNFLNELSEALNHAAVTTDPAVLKEAKDQAVYALMATGLDGYTIIANNTQLAWEQQELPLKAIPYVVLKGTAAAVYYPEPMRRTLGDIDLMVRPEDFSKAYRALSDAGYKTPDPIDGTGRHVHFRKNQVSIELHRRFATLQTREQEALLDQWIIEAIPNAVIAHACQFTFPMLPDQLNGLVILTHINQHLEEGLGIRQIVDWLMYVKHSLPDEAWPDFKSKTDQLGLTKLAKVCARLGQKYLKMNEEMTWCRDVQDSTVDAFIEYIFACGNFGHKDAANNTVVMVMSHGRGVKGFFKNLQRQGTANWKRLERTPWLKPFAWAYQLGRYMRRGLKTSRIRDFRKNMSASRKRNRLMDKLGATRMAFKD